MRELLVSGIDEPHEHDWRPGWFKGPTMIEVPEGMVFVRPTASTPLYTCKDCGHSGPYVIGEECHTCWMKRINKEPELDELLPKGESHDQRDDHRKGQDHHRRGGADGADRDSAPR